MDQRGGRPARELARALRQEGIYQAYVMKVGWSECVLGVSRHLPGLCDECGRDMCDEGEGWLVL
jgi:hypothetical protein